MIACEASGFHLIQQNADAVLIAVGADERRTILTQ
jgi:hypothetical protein